MILKSMGTILLGCVFLICIVNFFMFLVCVLTLVLFENLLLAVTIDYPLFSLMSSRCFIYIV